MRSKAEIMATRKGGPIPDLSYLAEDGRKKCKLCQETKSTEAFCKMARSLDGLETRCRDCNKARVRAIRDKTPGYNREHSKTFKQRHPEKRAAHMAVARALRAGTLKKLPCSVCGKTPSESHHDDYSQPLEVIWFCRAHHAAHHEKIRRLENSGHG